MPENGLWHKANLKKLVDDAGHSCFRINYQPESAPAGHNFFLDGDIGLEIR